MDNGIVQVYLANPGGFVTRIQYNGIHNLLETRNESGNRGYVCAHSHSRVCFTIFYHYACNFYGYFI